ncbi:MAG: undecaprenyldiphospho-muramoylpentapeptide beta-N-acetylglucosaminyltransferase [Sediminibacterium sp.]|jgi:UDP-N-acetylglucosamine--N-acetylmuramyl-(pentapeptide) pyrophosphoryl-undecaprenol N-acetylglucosamine transferase|nr:MAG: undecaprenyldiphospho-muramoylpentapeptide beta-N-acetylglucosaminyltransferase [Sediminibacterium sp.]
MSLKQKHNILRIIIAGGGTGGHIFPAVAVAQAIKALAPDAVILFVGALGKMEMEKVPQAGFEIKGITIAGFNRSQLLKNISLPWKLLKSFFQVSTIFKSFKPNAVFGVGGYSSFPVLKYAQTKNIPTYIHESNAFAGKANTWLANNTIKIFTGTLGMEAFFPAAKILVTGNPIRKNIIEHSYTKETALQVFHLEVTKKTILVIGGSLGASSINKAIQANLVVFFEKNIQLIWQTGKPNAEMYAQSAHNYENVFVHSFLDNMSAAYAAADIVISRSGAMAVAEICITGKPAVFVPYPLAAEDHQTFNAMTLVNKNAATMVKDKEVANDLIPTVLQLLGSEQQMQTMKNNIKAFAFTNADEIIAKEILKQINE